MSEGANRFSKLAILEVLRQFCEPKGLRLFNQVRACGQKRLDFVIFDPATETTVAVEPDGPDHYCEDGRTYSDAHLERVGVLKRAGWRLVHVPYYEWFRSGCLVKEGTDSHQRAAQALHLQILRVLEHHALRSTGSPTGAAVAPLAPGEAISPRPAMAQVPKELRRNFVVLLRQRAFALQAIDVVQAHVHESGSPAPMSTAVMPANLLERKAGGERTAKIEHGNSAVPMVRRRPAPAPAVPIVTSSRASVSRSSNEANLPLPLDFQRDAKRIRLINLRARINRETPVPEDQGILRKSMMNSFLDYAPRDRAEFERLVPRSLREKTNAAQMKYLDEIIAILR